MKKYLYIIAILLIFLLTPLSSPKETKDPLKNPPIINSLFEEFYKKDNKTLKNWAKTVLNNGTISLREIKNSLNNLEEYIIKIGDNVGIFEWKKQFEKFKNKLNLLKSDLTSNPYKYTIRLSPEHAKTSPPHALKFYSPLTFFFDRFALTFLGLRAVSTESTYAAPTLIQEFIRTKTEDKIISIPERSTDTSFTYGVSGELLFPWSFIAAGQYKDLDLSIRGDGLPTDPNHLINKFNSKESNEEKIKFFDSLPSIQKINFLKYIISTENLNIGIDLEALMYGVSPDYYSYLSKMSLNPGNNNLFFVNIFKEIFENPKYFRNIFIPGNERFKNPTNYDLLLGLIFEFTFLSTFNTEQFTADLNKNSAILNFFVDYLTQLFSNILTSNAAKECNFNLKDTQNKLIKDNLIKIWSGDEKGVKNYIDANNKNGVNISANDEDIYKFFSSLQLNQRIQFFYNFLNIIE